MKRCIIDNCGYPVFGRDKITQKGYCKTHQYLRTDKQKTQLNMRQVGDHGRIIKSVKDHELDTWFKERRKEMTGVCMHCGSKTTKFDDGFYKCSIAHILPKRIFKSVAAHPLNWIELCFWDPSCHTNFDNYTLDITELSCFDKVIERFVAMYPAIAPKERKYIPDVLLQYYHFFKKNI